MAKHRVLPGIIVFMLCITLACGILPVPSQTALPSSQNTPTGYLHDTPTYYLTSTYQQTPALPQNLPTPLATFQKPSPQQVFGDAKISDEKGTVVFVDSLARVNVNIQIRDSVTNNPIQQIEVQIIANGDEYLLAALDPSGKYFPTVKSGLFSSKMNLINNIIHTSGSLLINDVIQQQGGYELVYLTLELVDKLENIQSLQDLVNLLRGFPSIEKWGIGYIDTCWTGKQLADAFSVGSGVLGLVIPISGAAVTTTTIGDPNSGYEAGMVLSAAVAISTHLLIEDAEAYLQALPGAYTFRIYYFLAPFTIRAIDYLGPCKNSPPPNINFLIGTWQGDLVFDIGNGEKQVVSTTFRIRNECGVLRSPCVNYHLTNPSNDILMPFVRQHGSEYCFEHDVDVYCFTPQNDGTLKAYLQFEYAMREATMFFEIGNGYLHKIVP